MAVTSPQYPRPGESAQGRPLSRLFSDLWRETATLVHDEVELFKTEMSGKLAALTTGVAAVAVGGAILFAGFIVLLFAAVGALELLLDSEQAIWLAPLIIGLVVMIVGALALAGGLAEVKRENPRPERSLRSLREDGRMLKEHVK